jgi:hypothetical protein
MSGPHKPRGLEKERFELTVELVSLHDRAFRLGLLKTGHAIGEAVRAVGWERAELLEKEGHQ